jgi:hypothetical protein
MINDYKRHSHIYFSIEKSYSKKVSFKITDFNAVFRPKITQKKFGNSTFLIISTKAIDWCMNCHIW